MVCAGSRTAWYSLATVVAEVACLSARANTLVESWLVGMKGSSGLPAWEVHDVSQAAEGMEPSSTHCFNCCLVRAMCWAPVAELQFDWLLALLQTARAKLAVLERLRGLCHHALLLLSTWSRGKVKVSCLFGCRGLVNSVDRQVGGYRVNLVFLSGSRDTRKGLILSQGVDSASTWLVSGV